MRLVAEIDPDWICDRLVEVLGIIDRESVEEMPARVARVTVRLVVDKEMGDAHQRFSDVAGTTDVLAFASEEPDGLHLDVFACIDEARRRANELGHAVERELLLYALHGVLHALGHDDHDPSGHARMHAEEDRLLELAGVGPIFRPGGAS